jgi:hypothetical protein
VKLLEPDWNQAKPSWDEAVEMCSRVQLTQVLPTNEPFKVFAESINKSHRNGGLQLAGFEVGFNIVFDWFASRNRLTEFDVLDRLLVRPTIREALPELAIPDSFADGKGCSLSTSFGFGLSTSFTLDGDFARSLYHGGAYHKQTGDGRPEKELAIRVCDAMFGLRYGEVNRYTSSQMWTPFFRGIAWDSSDVLFDRRLRRLWIVAITDTD